MPMGRLVRLLRGEWQRATSGEWDFIMDLSERSYGIMVQEGEKYRTLMDMVSTRYQIQDQVLLTYQFPMQMLDSQGKRALPIDITEDGDVELFMAIRVEHIGLPLLVTVGTPAMERYRFHRRSAIDIGGRPHVFGETSMSLGVNQQVDTATYYWNSLLATGTIPVCMSTLEDIMNKQYTIQPEDVEERTTPLAHDLDLGNEDRSSTGSSDGPEVGSPLTPAKCGPSIQKWVEEDSLLGTTIANLSLTTANLATTGDLNFPACGVMRTADPPLNTNDKGKGIMRDGGDLGDSSTQLTLGSNAAIGMDFQMYTKLHSGDYEGLEAAGFFPASVKMMEEILTPQEMEMFMDAGPRMLRNMVPTKEIKSTYSPPTHVDTRIPMPVEGIIRLVDEPEPQMVAKWTTNTSEGGIGTPLEQGTGLDGCVIRNKYWTDSMEGITVTRKSDSDVRKNLADTFNLLENDDEERELRKLGFIPASLTVLEEIFSPDQMAILRKSNNEAVEMVRAKLTENKERCHVSTEPPITTATDPEHADLKTADTELEKESSLGTEDSEGMTEIQAMSAPDCFSPTENKMEGVEYRQAMSEPPDGYCRGANKMEIDDSDSDEEMDSGIVKNSPKELYVSMMFKNRDAFRQHMALYALAHKFRFHNKKSNPKLMVLECVGTSCPWRVYAIKMSDSDWYQIRRIRPNHRCSVNERGGFQRHATTEVIGDMIKTKYSGQTSGPRPGAVRDILRDGHDIPISYYKAWRSREIAMDTAKGSTGECFKKLPKFLHLLVIANPGSIAHIETECQEGLGLRFKYMFFALAASIKGYQYMRKVIIIDGTFLKGKYAGCLLTASCQDGNYQIYPLAFGVVDGENEKSYTWFFKKLQEIVPDHKELVFISDRHHAIHSSLAKVYPNANHNSCIVHLQRNVVSIFKKRHLSYLVGRAGRAYRVSEFAEHFEQIVSIDPECARYLQHIGIENWARSHSIGRRYNLMTSNIAESLNAALCEARDYPIIPLVEYIRATLMGWFHVRREAAKKKVTGLTPRIEKIIEKKFEISTGFDVKPINNTEYEVRTKEGVPFHVDMGMKTCSCNEFQTLSIPCIHAVSAAVKANIPVHSLAAQEFSCALWEAGYEGSIYPVPTNIEESLPEDDMANIELLPPLTRRPPGRPRKRRLFSRGEIQRGFQRKLRVCSRCKGVGHNRATCKAPI